LLRAECEWVKEYVKKNNIKVEDLEPEKINYIAKNNICDEFPGDFGEYQAGWSYEADIYSRERWGEAVVNFLRDRLDSNQAVDDSSLYSLSTVCLLESANDSKDHNKAWLVHPGGYILTRIEMDFQNLLKADNFLDFLISASRLLYALSNFPPVTRGSAAVHSWLDKIAEKKFNISMSLRPFLYDWAAFLESPNQYSNYYVIFSVMNFLKSMQLIDEDFEKAGREIMVKTPNHAGNLQERENLWLKLQSIIKSSLENNASSPFLENENTQKMLSDIAGGQLEFIKPSQQYSLLITKIIIDSEVNDWKNVVKRMLALSAEEKLYLKRLLELSSAKLNLSEKLNQQFDASRLNVKDADFQDLAKIDNSLLAQAFLFTYGTNNENEMNHLWIDSMALGAELRKRHLFTPLCDKKDFISLKNAKRLFASEETNDQFESFCNDTTKYDPFYTENEVCKWGLINPDNVASYAKLIELTQDCQAELGRALRNGLQLNQLNEYINSVEANKKDKDILVKEIQILSSDQAIFVYKAYPDIQLKELIKAAPKETQVNLRELYEAKAIFEKNNVGIRSGNFEQHPIFHSSGKPLSSTPESKIPDTPSMKKKNI
jgi:hypothetical protein